MSRTYHLQLRHHGALTVIATNKSGGTLAIGDVVIIDTTNDEAVTSTTTSASTRQVGVVAEPIASNATGHVAIAGYVSLVNVTASVTRGTYAETSTTAKKATSNATRHAGSFAQFFTGGTTPAAWLFGVPDASSGGGGGGGSMTVEQTGGTPSAASVTIIEVGSYTDNGGGDVTLFPQITGVGTGSLDFGGSSVDILDPSGNNDISANANLIYMNGVHTPANLAGSGIQLQVGDDFLGLYLSQKDGSTIQLYPDTNNDHAVELVDRGSAGQWHHVSEDGDVSVPALGRDRVLSSAPSSPVEGDRYYDSTLHKTRTFDGTVWQNHW